MNNLTDDDEISIHLERDPLLGQTLGGNYKVVSLIGRGGMGVVYKARHVAIDRMAAIKTLRIGHAGNPEMLRQFQREAKAVSQVSHPNTVKLYDFGVSSEGQPFLIMELLDGVPLRKVMKTEGPLPLNRVNDIFQQVIAALECAHEAGIVHKDLKPENIMLSQRPDEEVDWVHVLDFGISGLVNSGANQGASTLQLQPQEIVGSPPYMSPEQCDRTPSIIDGRSDVYSLAICIFEALSGTFPFKARTAMEVIECHLSVKPRLLRDIGMHTSTYESVSQLLNKALEKKPEKRHDSIKEFGRELQDAILKDSKRGMALKDRVSMEIPRTAEFVRVNKELIEELEEEELVPGRRSYFSSRAPGGFLGMLKNIVCGDQLEAEKEPVDNDKIIFFQCPHCGAETQQELSLCLCCGRSLAAKDDFSKLRAARGDFSLPKQKMGQKEPSRVARQEFTQRTKAAMLKTGRAWTRSIGLIFLSLLLVTCVFIISGGYHLVVTSFSKP